jgi:hypothetical protein
MFSLYMGGTFFTALFSAGAVCEVCPAERQENELDVLSGCLSAL